MQPISHKQISILYILENNVIYTKKQMSVFMDTNNVKDIDALVQI